MKPEISKRIEASGIIAVLIIEDVSHALPVAEALFRGGVDCIELTLRTPIALEAARLIKREFPTVALGLGTVISVEQVKQVADVGADFAMAPGCNPKIIREAISRELSFAPGVMTPSDIEIALENGCRLLKYFPASTAGGLRHLNNLAAPYKHLGLKFVPLGGLDPENAMTYLQSDLVAAVGGSWLARKELLDAGRWQDIRKNATQMRELIQGIRKAE
jgi:2-dehydro-3-deoxyphosphogluconate aldolase/(4S)-4-hydroxy-2-oxoglutarate aldolase